MTLASKGSHICACINLDPLLFAYNVLDQDQINNICKNAEELMMPKKPVLKIIQKD